MNETKISNDNSRDNYELHRNLFSNQIFKPTKESYDENGVLNEKQIKFQSDENGFLFSDGKIELEKNYLSDNEFGFGDAVEFIKQLENNSWQINAKINFDKVWNNIKSFFGFENENQNDEQKKLEVIFGEIANALKQNNVSKKFEEIRIKAKKLDDALNKGIKSTDRETLIKTSLEIKKYYFEFESSIKEILDLSKKIICQEKYLSDERLNNIKEKYGSGTENYITIESIFKMVKQIISRWDPEKLGYEKMELLESYGDMLEELLNLLEPDDIKTLSSRKDLINDIKQIISNDFIQILDELKNVNEGSIHSFFVANNLKNVDIRVEAFDSLYKILSDLESMVDNENLFYKIIDDEISEIETYLNEISKAKKHENQLGETSDQTLMTEYDSLNDKYQKESKFLSDIKDIYRAYKYIDVIIVNKASQNILLFKTNHNYYFWFWSHSGLFLIGHLFKFIAWIMTKFSRNLESDYKRYKMSLDKIKFLSEKNDSDIKSEDEFNDLCNKIFKNKNEVNALTQNFVIDDNKDYEKLAESLFDEIKNKFAQYDPNFNVDKNSLDSMVTNFSDQVAKDKEELQQLRSKIENQKNKIEPNQNPEDKIDFIEQDKSEKLSDIRKMRLRIKQLNVPYKILSALESQARNLEANRFVFSTLILKLLGIPPEKIEGKSVNMLLKMQDETSSKPSDIATLYFSKDKLNKIKKEQSENAKSGAFSTVFKDKDKILKPGKMRIICGSEEDKYDEISRLNCFKKNSLVLVDTAVKGNVAYEVAKLFGLDCIVSTSIAISDDNHISVMEDALKDGRVFRDECGENEINRINQLLKDPENAYKLFCSASELNFLDVLLLQGDRHNDNFSYNAVSVCGIDNDLMMPTKSSPIIRALNNSAVGQDSILCLAMIKISVIPEELYNKINSISSDDLRIILNLFYIDDDHGSEKVEFAIERFEKIKQFIKDGNITVVNEFNYEVAHKISRQNKMGKKLIKDALLVYICENFIPEIMPNYNSQINDASR